jgi:hypothetical protein
MKQCLESWTSETIQNKKKYNKKNPYENTIQKKNIIYYRLQ